MEIARSSPWVATTRWRHASTFVRSSKPLANALVMFLRLGERNSPAFERLLTLCQLRSSDALTFPTYLSPRRTHLRNAYLPSISCSCLPVWHHHLPPLLSSSMVIFLANRLFPTQKCPFGTTCTTSLETLTPRKQSKSQISTLHV